MCPLTSLSEEPRLWVIHTVRLSGKGPEQVMPWLFGLKGAGLSQSYQAEDERPEPGQQVLAVGQMPVRDCCSDSPSLANRYDEVFPPGRHEAFMVGRNATPSEVRPNAPAQRP